MIRSRIFDVLKSVYAQSVLIDCKGIIMCQSYTQPQSKDIEAYKKKTFCNYYYHAYAYDVML